MVGIDLLKEKGSLGFITTNYFLTSDSAQVLRQEFKDKTAIINFINFNDMKLFKSALGQHNIITILQKTNKIRKTNLINILKAKENFRDIFIDKANIEFFTKNSNQLYEGDNNYIRISKEGDKLEDIFSKITKYSSFINEICFINTGFNTGADKVTKSNLEKSYNEMPQNIKIKDGIFILTKKECEDIKPEKELIYKCYKNSDIEPYVSNKWQNLYVIWTNKNTNIKKYPNIKNHLNKYIEFLKLKREYETGQLPWYSQHWSREYDVFGNTNKIILPYRSKSNIFSYSDGEYFGSKDILYLRQRDKKFNIKYLLALLNSKLYYTWLYYKGKRKGETLELYVTPVGEIPIKKISKENQNPFEYMVNQIIEEKRKSKDIRLLENKVDLMVYKLYELDYDEIKIIDPDFDVVLDKFGIDKVRYEGMNIEELVKL